MQPFSTHAALDLDSIGRITRDAVRFLDNVIDLSPYPLAAQATEARATRRIGLGVTGLADALIMLGLRYDSDAGRALACSALTRIRDEAYATSIALAEEKGGFPCFDRDAYLAGQYVAALPRTLRDGIAEHGIRNSHLLAIAPAGSISILANNVSSGIEPVFAPRTERLLHEPDGGFSRHEALDYACAAFSKQRARAGDRPPAFGSSADGSGAAATGRSLDRQNSQRARGHLASGLRRHLP
jgi:ribonucleoside-diphosphate reductase alpha chain